MDCAVLLPGLGYLKVEDVAMTAGLVVVRMASHQEASACPRCDRHSPYVHSRYWRTLADLPWAAREVRLQVRARRFFCLTRGCPRRIFAERLPAVAAPSARQTARLRRVWLRVGKELSGQAGERLTAHLHLPASAEMLRRQVKETQLPPMATPRVIGIDDWALRKGQRYGTILVDLERCQPLACQSRHEFPAGARRRIPRAGVEISLRNSPRRRAARQSLMGWPRRTSGSAEPRRGAADPEGLRPSGREG